MELFEAIEKRRSVRQFRADRAVTDSELNRILGAAVMAPSAGNSQSWKFIVVRDKALRARLAREAGHQLFIEQAPVTIVVCADLDRAIEKYGERGRDTFVLQDTATATENILLAVEAMGLGACWIGSFEEAKAAEILGLRKGLRPVAMIPIGAPAEPAKRVPPRRSLDEVVEFR